MCRRNLSDHHCLSSGRTVSLWPRALSWILPAFHNLHRHAFRIPIFQRWPLEFRAFSCHAIDLMNVTYALEQMMQMGPMCWFF